MKIFAISDLHLSLGSDKPMDIFGDQWIDHHLHIARDWESNVAPSDLVLLAGDHSWGLKLSEALPDLTFIGRLPGQKLLIKGNHDLWWQSRTKIEQVMDESMHILQNDSYRYGSWSICGTRGWITPQEQVLSKDDEKIYQRELLRLKMSLEHAKSAGNLMVMMHYPPVTSEGVGTEFSRLMEEYGVKKCVYGHLHGASTKYAFEGEMGGIEYRLVSADHLHFKLLRLF